MYWNLYVIIALFNVYGPLTSTDGAEVDGRCRELSKYDVGIAYMHGRCYSLTFEQLSWDESKLRCEERGGQLWSVTTTDLLPLLSKPVFIGHSPPVGTEILTAWAGAGHNNFDYWIDGRKIELDLFQHSDNFASLVKDLFSGSRDLCMRARSLDAMIFEKEECDQKYISSCQHDPVPIPVPVIPPTSHKPKPSKEVDGRCRGLSKYDVGIAYMLGRCYSLTFEQLSWDESKLRCEERGGQLWSVTTTNLLPLLAEPVFIGGTVPIRWGIYQAWAGAGHNNFDYWIDGKKIELDLYQKGDKIASFKDLFLPTRDLCMLTRTINADSYIAFEKQRCADVFISICQHEPSTLTTERTNGETVQTRTTTITDPVQTQVPVISATKHKPKPSKKGFVKVGSEVRLKTNPQFSVKAHTVMFCLRECNNRQPCAVFNFHPSTYVCNGYPSLDARQEEEGWEIWQQVYV